MGKEKRNFHDSNAGFFVVLNLIGLTSALIMRIIAGKSGGIKIQVPAQVTRPTTDRVREALFSSLGSLVEGANVLDLFAGSGALGIEALSRGADSAVFVEQARKACAVINANLEKTATKASATVQNRKVESYLKSNAQAEASFDLIFADPPYGKDSSSQQAISRLVESAELKKLLKPDGVFILENSAKADELYAEGLTISSSRSYGECRITYYTLS